MSNFVAEIQARLDDWVENALDPQAAPGVLRAVVNLHDCTIMYPTGRHACEGCDPVNHAIDWPCTTLKTIAKLLGIEHV